MVVVVVNLTVDIFCIEFYPHQGHIHHLLLFTEHGLRDHKAEAGKGGTSPDYYGPRSMTTMDPEA